MKKLFAPFVFITLFVVLAFTILSMPSSDSVAGPDYNETTHHYLSEALEETGATNVVAAVLTDYRAWDTLGETIVLFTAIVAVVSVLRKRPTAEVKRHE